MYVSGAQGYPVILPHVPVTIANRSLNFKRGRKQEIRHLRNKNLVYPIGKAL